MLNLDINIAVDFWRNADRITREAAKAFVDSRNWRRLCQGHWASKDALVSLEVVPGPGKTQLNALVWIVDL